MTATCKKLSELADQIVQISDRLPSEGSPSWTLSPYETIKRKIRARADQLRGYAQAGDEGACREYLRIFAPAAKLLSSDQLQEFCRVLGLTLADGSEKSKPISRN